jgi:FkbM family methyltransferase
MLREEVGYAGTIISFEPCATSFRHLSADRSKDRQWWGYPYGLSDSNHEALLNTFGERGSFNSVLPLRESGARLFGVDTSQKTIETIQLRQLDTVWKEVMRDVASPRVFVKIDTQGHDTAVIRGTVEHMQFIHGIQSELPVVEIYESMVSMAEALTLYKDFGYVPIGFYPVARPAGANGVSPEFDVLFSSSPDDLA